MKYSRPKLTAAWMAVLFLCAVATTASGQIRGLGVKRDMPVPAKVAQNADANSKEKDAAPRKRVLVFGGKNFTKLRVPWRTMDGAGYTWDIYNYGQIQYGTNYCYSGGMMLQISGNSFSPSGYEGLVNKQGDEIQLGPWTRSNVKYFRRVRVYKNVGLARWMEVMENTSDKEVSVTVRIYTNAYGSIHKKRFSHKNNGKFSDQDWWFITETQSHRNSPAVLHVVHDPASKIQPKVSISGSNIHYDYTIKIPPKETRILCHFEAQGKFSDLTQFAEKRFQAYRYLRDLPADARENVVNFPPTFAFGGLVVRRREEADTVVMRGSKEEVLRGEITTESFAFGTDAGEFSLPSKDLVCIKLPEDEDSPAFAILGDGQVLVGTLLSQELTFKPDGKGPETFPAERLRELSFRADERRPMEIPFAGPYVELNSGQRLAFDGRAFSLRFLTRFGAMTIKPKDILGVDLGGQRVPCHRVLFRNGSVFAGFLREPELELSLRLGSQLRISRHEVSRLLFHDRAEPNPFLSRVALTNGDGIFGQLVDESYRLTHEYGTVDLGPEHIRKLTFATKHKDRVSVETWEGTQMRAMLGKSAFKLKVTPDVTLSVDASHCTSITRSQPTSPEKVLSEVNAILAKVTSVSGLDAAEKELRQYGTGIIPLLEKQRDATGITELRRRYQEMISDLRGESQQPVQGPNMFMGAGPFPWGVPQMAR
jgi:hypothetical protein